MQAQNSAQMTLDQYQAQLARDEALATVELHADDDWKSVALRVVAEVASRRVEFTTDDVLDVLRGKSVRTHEMRALGPVMMMAQRMGYITPTNTVVKSRAVSRHCAPKRVWKSNVVVEVANVGRSNP